MDVWWPDMGSIQELELIILKRLELKKIGLELSFLQKNKSTN